MNTEEKFVPIRNLVKSADKCDNIDRILESVVLLDNGLYGYVYRDMGLYRGIDKKYMCNVCKRILMFNKNLISHNAHPNHKNNLKIPMHCPSKFHEVTKNKPRESLSENEEDEEEEAAVEEETSVTPGEPVPPGLEDIVDSVSQIQSTFDSFKSGPLIGLEYIVELISIEQVDAEPRYICLLCEKKGDPRSVMVHVTSYNHYLKYICCFFRTVGNKLNLIPKSSANRSAINTAIIKVAEAIEKHYGRLKPTSTEMETFSTKKYQILREIDEKEHFRETPTTTFLELVTAAKMEEYSKAPVVNFNTKDLEAKNEFLTKKCMEVNQKNTSFRMDKKPAEKAADPKLVPIKTSQEIKMEPRAKKTLPKGDSPSAAATITNSLNPPKKLCIALNKPERSIPGISKSQVQNSDIIIKKEDDADDDDVGDLVIDDDDDEADKEDDDAKKEEDDDVIILQESDSGPIEVQSLSSVSTRSRSWSGSRTGNRGGRSRSPRRQRSKVRSVTSRHSERRSRSRDRFGRVRRESSYERHKRERDIPSRERERTRRERDYDYDRSRRDMDDRRRGQDDRSSRRDYEDRRRMREYEERGWRASSRHRDSSWGRHGDNRGRHGDSRGRYDDTRDLDDRRRSDDRGYSDRDRLRNPSSDRFRKEDYSKLGRDRNYESEDRSHHIAENMRQKMKWNNYKDELSKLEDDLAKTYKFYQGHPEKHPSYNEEWKAFWNRRYKEIQMSGQDPSKYDFKPEWILFWEKKMKEIHEQKVIVEKESLKRKHKLDELQDIRGDKDLQDISPPTPEPYKDVTVNDIKKTWKALTGSEISAPKRATSPWESRAKDREPPNPSSDSDHGLTSQQFFATTKKPGCGVAPVPPVIHCLRMLSVLEHQIGFQAARVIDLLSQGLAMEKTKNNHSMQMLQNKDNYIFFEAMKEKLRGQLMAGIVQRHLVNPTRNIIKTIEGMLEANPLKPEVFEPVNIPGVGQVDKVSVAQKIAGALIKMGKTNVCQEELEQLINAVVGMAKASSVSADVSSDKFFSQLNIKNSNASSHINNILNTLIQTAQQSVVEDIPQLIVAEKTDPYNNNTADIITMDNQPQENLVEAEAMSEEKVVERGPSPFSLRTGGTNPIKDKCEEMKDSDMAYDDDDDDYSFEDVYHAASEKLKKSEENKNPSSVTDENSETQSSLTSATNVKTVTDVLNSIDAATLSNLGMFSGAQNSNETSGSNPMLITGSVADIGKSINLNDLKSILNQSKAAVVKPVIDMSLIESIKDTLVQSFAGNNQQTVNPVESCYSEQSFGSSIENKPRERPTLDPRNRSVWDPSIKALDRGGGEYGTDRSRMDVDPCSTNQWDERGGNPSAWDSNAWNGSQRERESWDGRGGHQERARWEDRQQWPNNGSSWQQQNDRPRGPTSNFPNRPNQNQFGDTDHQGWSQESFGPDFHGHGEQFAQSTPYIPDSQSRPPPHYTGRTPETNFQNAPCPPRPPQFTQNQNFRQNQSYF